MKPRTTLTSPIEDSRIRFALRGCKTNNYPIYGAHELVKIAFEKFGDSLAVACSFGKCSVAVLHMALQINPNVKVVFNDTTVLYPEDYAYKDFLKKEWNLNLIETKPVKPFWQVWKEYGPPTIRRQYYHSYAKYKGLWKRHTFQDKTGKPACCWFCKDKPFLLAAKQHNIKAVLTGLRCTESRARMYFAADYGQIHYTKRYKIWKVHPILFWKSDQLEAYHEQNKIPPNPLYTEKGLLRNGCQPCTGFLNWEKELARTNLKMYKFVQKLRGQGLIDDYLTEDKLIQTCAEIAHKQLRQAILEDWF